MTASWVPPHILETAEITFWDKQRATLCCCCCCCYQQLHWLSRAAPFFSFAHILKTVTKHNCRFPSRCFIWTGCPPVGKRLSYLQPQRHLLIRSDERGRQKEIKYFDFWRIFLAFTVAQKPMTRSKIHTDYKSISLWRQRGRRLVGVRPRRHRIDLVFSADEIRIRFISFNSISKVLIINRLPFIRLAGPRGWLPRVSNNHVSGGWICH